MSSTTDCRVINSNVLMQSLIAWESDGIIFLEDDVRFLGS